MAGLEAYQIEGAELRGGRTVWVARGVTARPELCLVFLDAELYLQKVRSEEIVSSLISGGRIPDATRVYVSYREPADRHIDFTCSQSYSHFLVHRLLPWITRQTHEHRSVVLCGLSLSGLAAAFAACEFPESFSGVLCQSPSAWWNGEWITRHFDVKRPGGVKFWISVGTEETDECVFHTRTLFQATSQLDSCRRLAEAVSGAAEVGYVEFPGGHDFECWARDLPQGLEWLVQAWSEGFVAGRGEGPDGFGWVT